MLHLNAASSLSSQILQIQPALFTPVHETMKMVCVMIRV